MSVFKIKRGKARKLPWRAVVSRKGEKPLVSHFASREEAKMWEADRSKAYRLRDLSEYKQARELEGLRRYTVRDLVYDHIKLNPDLGVPDVLVLHAFARDPVCAKSVIEFSKQDANRWIEKKRNGNWKPPGSNGTARPITPRTVRRQVNIIQRVFQYAIDTREGFAALPNHFRGMKIQGSKGGCRERALEPGEYERILKSAEKCRRPNNFYVPLAIFLALETGMRRQEIFNLTWGDIDKENRRITIRKQKTDKVMGRGPNSNGTAIVLPLKAKMILDERFFWWKKPAPDQRVFPMTEQAFSQSWRDTLRRAGITDLHFHDLRREANTQFIKAGLLLEERNIMLRHEDKSMNATYQGRNHLLREIQKKLDQYIRGKEGIREHVEEYLHGEPVAIGWQKVD